MFAVVVTLTIASESRDTFAALMQTNAQTSLQDEPGCHRFDVCRDSADPDTVFLYELYDDRAAFDHHLQSDHFKAFDAAVADMVLSKDVRTFDQVAS
jgi:quinol monooxygenase YgiN